MKTERAAQLAPPADDMSRLNDHGFSLLPLGGGTDGKRPLVSFDGKPRLKLGQVLGPMHGRCSACYGIRLDGLLLIDCDIDDEDLVRDLEARFGESPVPVKTPRGSHLYYASGGPRPNLRKEGLQVDVKTGASSYVAGPGSVRPDGGTYTLVKGDLCTAQLPRLNAPERPRQATLARPQIEVGRRNDVLVKIAVAQAAIALNEEVLATTLAAVRNSRCQDPDSMSDDEIRKIAKWAWDKRRKNKLYGNCNSELRLERMALGRLKGKPGSEEAIALYTVLQDLHGHVPGKTFALVYNGMRSAGHITMSERRFLKARKRLERERLLECASPAVRGTRHQTFRLLRPVDPDLDCGRGREEEGGGFITYICAADLRR